MHVINGYNQRKRVVAGLASFAVAAVAGILGVPVSSAIAAPLGAGLESGLRQVGGSSAADANIMPVHFRGWQHCHDRYGNRWCHGRHYGNGPDVYLQFRFGNRHWRDRGHHRDNHHNHHNRKWH